MTIWSSPFLRVSISVAPSKQLSPIFSPSTSPFVSPSVSLTPTPYASPFPPPPPLPAGDLPVEGQVQQCHGEEGGGGLGGHTQGQAGGEG